MADPHAGHGRRELSRSGRLLRAARPVSVSPLGEIHPRGHAPGVRQGDPEVLLDPLQHRLRRHDPHRRQPGHHSRLRSTLHDRRHGRGQPRYDQRTDLHPAGRDRRDVAHPRAQAQRAPAPRFARPPARPGGGDDRLQPGLALPAQLRRAFDGWHDAAGQAFRRPASHQ